MLSSTYELIYVVDLDLIECIITVCQLQVKCCETVDCQSLEVV